MTSLLEKVQKHLQSTEGILIQESKWLRSVVKTLGVQDHYNNGRIVFCFRCSNPLGKQVGFSSKDLKNSWLFEA